MYRTKYVRKSLDTPGEVNRKPAHRIGEATWDSVRTGMRARSWLVGVCKLYGAYLTGDVELYGTYLAYHTGKVRQVSESVVCMRLKRLGL